jgi:hypothetical protein
MLSRQAHSPWALALVVALAACGKTSSTPTRLGGPSPSARGVPVSGAVVRSATIDPVLGGSVTSSDGRVTVSAPAGAVSSPLTITVEEITNTAPGGVGFAYRLGPEGTVFTAPVRIAFSAAGTTVALDELAIAYQEHQGWWLRLPASTRDATAQTVTVDSLHLSDWSLVGRSPQDQRGTFHLTWSRLGASGPTVNLTGDSTLTYVGQDPVASYFLQWGTVTASASLGSTPCTVVAPAAHDLNANVAELLASQFRWGVSGDWGLECSGASYSANVVFDTMGVNDPIRCGGIQFGPQTLTTTAISGSATVSCTDGAVSASWTYASCTPGGACHPDDNVCQNGTVSCDTGYAQCVFTGNVADTTSCGTDLACQGGACTCVPGPDPATCASVDSCHSAAITCPGNVPTCTQTALTGTSCGVDMVCQAGACTCNPGPDPVTCPSTSICDSAAITCGTNNTPQCTHTAINEGTSCGTGLTCQGGVCACSAGVDPAVCPTDACNDNAVQCVGGTPSCLKTPLTGNSCGTDMVCQDGTCTCQPGPDPVNCPTLNACDSATMVCDTPTSAPRCVHTALGDGTSCGTNMACAAGVCTCQPGTSPGCTAQDVCHTAAITCSGNTPSCTQTAKPDATSCGTDMACQGGVCTCVPGPDPATCSTTDPCQDAAITCPGNTPTCTFTTKANGATCGGGQTCNAGACVASQTVSGTRTVTSWPESGAGTAVAAPDVSGATIEALVPDGKGGFVTYPGTFAQDGSGSFSVPGVPSAGGFWLVFVGGDGVKHVLDSPASPVDLGYDLLGRADVALATAGTDADFVVTGFAPGDLLEATSANADVHVQASVAAAAPSPTSVNWFAAAGGAPAHLLGAADPLVVHQLSASTADTSAGLLPVFVASGAVSVSGTVMDPGVATTLFAELVPPTTIGSLAVDWRTSQFEALVAGMGPAGTAVSAHTLSVGASAWLASTPGPVAQGAPTLAVLSVAPATPDLTTSTAIGYAQFLPAPLWSEWREVSMAAQTTYAYGTATALTEVASVVERVAMPGATPVQPALSPVQAPLVSGLDALSPQTGVGLTPTLSWTAPASGTVTAYLVELRALGAANGATVSTPVAAFTTTATSVAVPPSYLQPGGSYYARIEAITMPVGGPSAPFRSAGTWSRASTLTAVFTP